jgi:uncharacterized protein involved in type VI secretion and phage assembly
MALPTPLDGAGPRYFGVYPAIVTDLVDSRHLGRVEVRFPTLGTSGDRDVRAWATLCSPYADDDQGLEVVPEANSQVVVAFEAGDFRRPYIIGSCWNGKRSLPRAEDRANNIRVLRSRSKSEFEFDDTIGAAKVSITMASGHRVVLDDGAQEVTIQHANGSVIRVTKLGAIEIQATSSVDVKAPTVNVTAATSTFSGVVKCSTMVADAFVISPAYTPGVGNLL